MGSFYEDFREADFGALETLAAKWKHVHDAVKDLDDKVRDHVLKPLRDKGYWEGMAAPYAWTQIDDIQRQVTAAATVVDGVRKAIEDGAGELKAAQRKLTDLVAGLQDQGLYVNPKTAEVMLGECAVDGPTEEEAKKRNDAQTRLNALMREAFEADQNLAVTLMENIGLEQWFNTGTVRTDINHTDTIGTDRYDTLGRDMDGLDPFPSTNHLTPRTLLTNWVAGTGDDHYDFSQHDAFVEQLRRSESMDGIRAQTVEGWRAGRGEGSASYYIGGKSLPKQVGTYAQDMAGLSGVDNLWGGDTNEAQSLLGSYHVGYEVKGTDPDGRLVVQYTLNNDTDMESFLPGYQSWQAKANHGSGPTAGISETMVWTERIDPADH